VNEVELIGLERRDTVQVEADGERFEVGPDIELFAPREQTRVRHEDYADTPQYLALGYGALRYAGLEHVERLMLGLPVHLMGAKADALKARLAGTHRIDAEHSVRVERVGVVVQPIGGFVHHARTRGLWEAATAATNLLVDFGNGTTDWLVTRGMTATPGRRGSVRCGVADLLRALEDQLIADTGATSIGPSRLERALRRGTIEIRGRKLALAPYLEAARSVWEPALVALENSVGDVDDIENVFVVGGGAALALEALQARLPTRTIEVVDDPVFANVKGFQLIGRATASRRAGRIAA
jgi:plasmid segregation protein ParM